MFKKSSFSCRPILVFCLCLAILATVFDVSHAEEAVWDSRYLVKREQRTTLVSTEYGEISAVRVRDNVNGSYLLHFFTLEPNSLFLPVLLHADMVFYVQTGSGKLSWAEDNDLKSTELLRGDVYALQQGSVFFIQSNLETSETERQKLRIHAIFANSKNSLQGPTNGPYSSIREMVIGFGREVLQAAYKVSEEVIDELMGGTRPPAIVHGVKKTKRTAWEMETQFVRNLLRGRSFNIFEVNKKNKRTGAKAYNLFKGDKDFKNCNGWSTTVTRSKLSALRGTNFGVFMVNLTIGSMMGPHWNPMAAEVAVVLQGHGMVRVVCSSVSNETACRNMRFEVEEGDVFLVPRFHAMAQMAFNNETFVFMGFSTSTKKNHPQFLAGQASVLRTLDKDVLAMSFNVTNTTLNELLAKQHDSVILGCISCAEEELRRMEEEIEREREEVRKREEEAARQREEERRREEEEEARKREEEEARKEEEEKTRQEEEEERRKEEEEARKREAEEERRKKEEEARREEEEERRRQQEEEEARREEAERRRQEEEETHREQEEARQREEQAAEKERRREEKARREEEAARQQEQERERQQEEAQQAAEEERRREEEAQREEAAKQKERERERETKQEEARQAAEEERQREGEAQREEEAARQQEREREEERRREEEAQREEEAARQQERERERQQEEARQREQEQEEARRRQQQAEEEEARQRQQEHEEEAEVEEASRRSEEEAAAEQERRWKEETQREEEAARQQERQRQQQEGGGGRGGGYEEEEGGGWSVISEKLAL